MYDSLVWIYFVVASQNKKTKPSAWFFVLWEKAWDSNKAGVNDSPVDCQSRRRPRRVERRDRILLPLPKIDKFRQKLVDFTFSLLPFHSSLINLVDFTFFTLPLYFSLIWQDFLEVIVKSEDVRCSFSPRRKVFFILSSFLPIQATRSIAIFEHIPRVFFEYELVDDLPADRLNIALILRVYPIQIITVELNVFF